jgi:quinol monooxygenase YgiN
MVKLAILATLQAKAGKEEAVKQFLQNALPLVQMEANTINWFAFQISKSTFGIFDTFNTEEGRDAHISGQIVAALMENAPDLFENEPNISAAEVLAVKG